MRYRLQQLLVILAVLLVTLWPASALAASADFPANVSGLEVFPGIRNGNIAYGTTFAGWVGGTGANPSGWQACSPGSTCGNWEIVLTYEGTPGLGSSVGILKGGWSLTMPNRHRYFGTVTGGTVVWPADLVTSLGCGPGVATVSVALTFNSDGTGSFQGCLDDTHLRTVFPPHVWGTISKS
jgi:hypothetical protein